MTTKSKKSEPKFLQTKNPRTKRWIKIDAKSGKIISTKTTPGKYKGIKVAKIAKPSAKAAKPVKASSKRAKSLTKKPVRVAQPRVKISEQTKADIAAAKSKIATLEANHLAQVLAHTGKVLPEDRKYCKSLGKRMLEKQFPILKK